MDVKYSGRVTLVAANARAPVLRVSAMPSRRGRGWAGNASGPSASGDPAEAALKPESALGQYERYALEASQ